MEISTNTVSWLKVIRAPGMASRKLISAIESAGSITALISADSAHLRQLGFGQETVTALRQSDEAGLNSDLEWLSCPGHGLLTWDSDSYPALLRRIPSPPASGRRCVGWRRRMAVAPVERPPRKRPADSADARRSHCFIDPPITSVFFPDH